jgi:hypothetical protein
MTGYLPLQEGLHTSGLPAGRTDGFGKRRLADVLKVEERSEFSGTDLGDRLPRHPSPLVIEPIGADREFLIRAALRRSILLFG